MIDFPALHPDLLDEDVIEKFSETNGLILDTHILTAQKDIYGIDLFTESGGTLEQGIYYFRLTGVADDYTEQLLAENQIITGGTEKIAIYPYIRLGRENPRFTQLKLYFSTDNITFEKTKEYDVRKDTSGIGNWKIDQFGRLILKTGTELYTEGSAVSTINEQDSFGSWTEHNMDGTFEIDETQAAEGGTSSFKLTVNPFGSVPPDSLRRGIKVTIQNLKLSTAYTVNCYLKMNLNNLFEDFEDATFDDRLSLHAGSFGYEFVRVNTDNPIDSWHIKAEGHINIILTTILNGGFIRIEIDKPKTLEFYLRGLVSVYKQIGSNPIVIVQQFIEATGSSYTEDNKITVDINDNNLGVKIYIVHQWQTILPDDERVWTDCFIDNITVKVFAPNRTFFAFITGESLSTEGILQKEIESVTSEFEPHTFDLITGGNVPPLYFVFAYRPTENEQAIFWLDEFSFKEKELIYFDKAEADNPGTEMSSEMGYTPTYDLVKAWDFVLIFRGRIYYFNPYTDKRFENFIMLSHIHSNGSFMWDIASASNFRELERFDASKAIGAVLLATTEIMILKSKSIEILDDDGTVGILREPILGISCVSRESIVDILGTILWAGNDEIYSFGTSKGVTPLLKNTIRNIYIALPDKHLIRGIRDRWHTYRIRVYDTENKTEFLLTDNGWVEEAKFHFPVIYREDFKGRLNFFGVDGKIYGTLYELDNIGYGRLYATSYGQRL